MTEGKRSAVTEIKAFVPAKDFALSKRFYQEIGFTMASEGGGIAYFHVDDASFLLQDFCAEGFAENFGMHMLVEDVDAWWRRIRDSGVEERYGVTVSEITQQPWRMRDFCLSDPSGVVWRIAENTKSVRSADRRATLDLGRKKSAWKIAAPRFDL